jgi:hypothetical protein
MERRRKKRAETKTIQVLQKQSPTKVKFEKQLDEPLQFQPTKKGPILEIDTGQLQKKTDLTIRLIAAYREEPHEE